MGLGSAPSSASTMNASGIDARLSGLLRYVESVRKRPYDPVAHNCALFAAGAVKALRGDDPLTELGLKIESQQDVDRALSAGGVRAWADKYLGPMQPPLLARRGDVVVKRGRAGDTLGVCMGTHALFLAEDGLQRRGLAECEGCWRVA